jgi:hypothetical protein
MLSIFKRLVLLLAGIYLLLCIALYFHQTKFIFVPQRKVEFTPRDYGCKFDDVQFQSGGKTLHGWRLPADDSIATQVGGRTLLYFHGNGGSIGANAAHACRLNHIGFSVLIFDYRGFGQSEGGLPTENHVYEDAEAAWQYLEHVRNTGAHQILIYGHSLGGAVAIEMATRHPDAAALIAESAFTSIQDMAEQSPAFRLFPVRFILNQHMDSLKKIASVHMPVLFIHGLADNVVPATMSERLYAAAPGSKQILLVPGAAHENAATVAGSKYKETVLDFVRAIPQVLPARAAAR